MSHLVTEKVKITPATTTSAGAAAQTAIAGATLDMAGFDGVVAIVPVGAIVATGVQSFKWQQGATASPTTDLEGTSLSIAVAEADTTFYSTLHKPTKRYVRIYVTRGTANSTFGGITYVQYGPGVKKVTHATTVTAGEEHISPAEGTA